MNAATWLDERSYSDRLWIKNSFLFTLFFILYYLWAPPPIVCSIGHALSHPMKNCFFFVFFFTFLVICLYVKNQCDPVISSGGICDQRILQSNRLKAFPAITQKQKFSQIWDLYSKIDDSIILRSFSGKINEIFFPNIGKKLFFGSFLIILCFCPKGIFPKKSD